MLYMVIERFKNGDAEAVYRRLDHHPIRLNRLRDPTGG